MSNNLVQIDHVAVQIKKHGAIYWTIQNANGDYLDRQDKEVTIDDSVAQFYVSAKAIKGDFFKVRICAKKITELIGNNLKVQSFSYNVVCMERILPDYQYLNPGMNYNRDADNNRILDLQLQLIEERHKRQLEDLERSFQDKIKKDPGKEKRTALIEKMLEHLFLNEMNKPGSVAIANHPAPIAGSGVDEMHERLKLALQQLQKATGGKAELIDTLEKLVQIHKDNPTAFITYVKMIRGI